MDDELYWRLQARVHRAHARAHASYPYNVERQQQAEALKAAAKECDTIADEFAAEDWT